MSRLPRPVVMISVAVPGAGSGRVPDSGGVLARAGAAAVTALVDGGLDASCVTPGEPTDPFPREVALALGRFGLGERLTAVPGPLAVRPSTGGGRPFGLVSAASHHREPHNSAPCQKPAGVEAPLGRWDAVILIGELLPVGWPQPWGTEYLFGGVFHTELEGIFRVTPRPELATVQARWIGEYLRGRYLLPSRSAMVRALGPACRPTGHGPGGRPTGHDLGGRGERGYLRALDRELRRGHARAATAGYPLPVPSRLD